MQKPFRFFLSTYTLQANFLKMPCSLIVFKLARVTKLLSLKLSKMLFNKNAFIQRSARLKYISISI